MAVAEPVPGLPGAFWAVAPIGEHPDPSALTPAERTAYGDLKSDRRRREWLAGRQAGRIAARAVGAGAASILRGPEGGPVLVGPGEGRVDLALTHGEAYAAAVALPRGGAYPHVGIDWVDARDGPRLARLAPRVLDPDEAARCAGRDLWLRAAWGAKEAVAKATRTGMFAFGLGAVRLTHLDEASGRIDVSLPGAWVRLMSSGEAVVVVAAVTDAAFRAARR